MGQPQQTPATKKQLAQGFRDILLRSQSVKGIIILTTDPRIRQQYRLQQIETELQHALGNLEASPSMVSAPGLGNKIARDIPAPQQLQIPPVPSQPIERKVVSTSPRNFSTFPRPGSKPIPVKTIAESVDDMSTNILSPNEMSMIQKRKEEEEAKRLLMDAAQREQELKLQKERIASWEADQLRRQQEHDRIWRPPETTFEEEQSKHLKPYVSKLKEFVNSTGDQRRKLRQELHDLSQMVVFLKTLPPQHAALMAVDSVSRDVNLLSSHRLRKLSRRENKHTLIWSGRRVF